MNRQNFNLDQEFDFRSTSLKQFYSRLTRWIDFHDKDVLSIGSSEGGELDALSSMGAKSLSGIDIDKERVAYSKTRFDAEKVHIEVSMAEDLPIEDDSVDLISCLEVIEHVQDPDKVLSEMYRVLRENGMAVITFPSYDAISGPHLDHIVKVPWLQHFIGLDGLREKARKKHLKASGEDIQEWDPLNKITIRQFKRLISGRFEIVHEQILSPYYFCKVMLKLGVMKDLWGDRCRFIVRRV